MTDDELVRWAATKVMGWKRCLIPPGYNSIGYYADIDGKLLFTETESNIGVKFAPRSDLNHAWMVVEKLIDSSQEVPFWIDITGYDKKYRVVFGRHDMLGSSTDKNVCRAIIKAARAAWEAEAT